VQQPAEVEHGFARAAPLVEAQVGRLIAGRHSQPLSLWGRLRRFVVLLLIGLSHPRRREFLGFVVLDLVRAVALPGYLLGDYAKSWQEDTDFLEELRAVSPHEDRSAERKFFLRSLAGLVAHLPGDTAEAGTFEGASSWFICRALQNTGKTHHAFDSFEGLSTPTPEDAEYWRKGELRAREETVRELLSPFDTQVHKGWIPKCFEAATIDRLCFAHIDVDLYEPTLQSMEFFYPLVVQGGIIVCDDYGSALCPGATQALDEFVAGRPEKLVHAPTGQAFLVKQ